MKIQVKFNLKNGGLWNSIHSNWVFHAYDKKENPYLIFAPFDNAYHLKIDYKFERISEYQYINIDGIGYYIPKEEYFCGGYSAKDLL